VGRGITRGMLQAGATVIVNSRSEQRLATLQETLGYPSRLVTVHGSLLPGQASRTVTDTLASRPLHHVVAHGAVRWWARPTAGSYEYYEFRAGCDESYSLNIQAGESLLSMAPEQFVPASAQLAALHLSAAQQLIPRLATSGSTYTFVTGDGSGKPGGERTVMGEINSHHVWGLSAALRHELRTSPIMCREIRVGLPVHTDSKGRRPVSEMVGDLCAGLAAQPTKEGDQGRLIKLDDFETMNAILTEYNVAPDESIGELPHFDCDHGTLVGSL